MTLGSLAQIHRTILSKPHGTCGGAAGTITIIIIMSESSRSEPVAKRRKKRSQPKLVVCGAGIDAVNGEYELDDNTAATSGSSSTITYQKQGVWKEQPALFKLSLGNSESGGKKIWSLVVVREDNNNTLTRLYRSDAVGDGSVSSKTPPYRCWWDVRYPQDRVTQPPIVRREGVRKLDWREHDDPDEAGLWTIRVNQAHVYVVHQLVLRNATEYFRGVVSHDFVEQQNKSSEIELGEDVANVFPYFLDYIYMHYGGEISLCPPISYLCPLFWLGSYFGAEQLMEDILDRIKVLAKGDDFYKVLERVGQAKSLGIRPILHALAQCCKKRLKDESLIAAAALKSTSDATFWIKVLKKGKEWLLPSTSKKASVLVASLCQAQPIPAELFQKLTSSSSLPYIADDAALKLLAIEADIVGYEGASALTSLQERCIQIFLSLPPDDASQNVLASQPPYFLVELHKISQQRFFDLSTKLTTVLDAWDTSTMYGRQAKRDLIRNCRVILENKHGSP